MKFAFPKHALEARKLRKTSESQNSIPNALIRPRLATEMPQRYIREYVPNAGTVNKEFRIQLVETYIWPTLLAKLIDLKENRVNCISKFMILAGALVLRNELTRSPGQAHQKLRLQHPRSQEIPTRS